MLCAMAQQPEKHPMVGKTAQNFTLETIYNGVKTLEDARAGRKAIVFFWATWCPYCREALQRLNSSVESLKRRGYSIVLVNVGEDPSQVKAYLQFHTIFLDSFLDVDNSLQQAYAIVGVPTFYYVDEQGIIVGARHEFESSVEMYFSPKPAQ